MTETPEAQPAASDPISEAVAPGYRFEGPALELGGLMLDADNLSDVHIKIPLGMLNRHGLVAGATGTGKTKTLQLLAEQLSANGVPVFAADIKGDLSGISVPGESSDKLTARTASVGPIRSVRRPMGSASSPAPTKKAAIAAPVAPGVSVMARA